MKTTKKSILSSMIIDDNEDYEEINIATMIIDDNNSETDDPDDYYYDTVAILKLEEGSSIEPVTLDTGSTNLSVDTEVTVLGWGLASIGIYDDDILGIDDEEVDELLAKIAPFESCELYFSSEEAVITDFDKILCTNRTDAEDFFDICHGDVGSAVIVKGSSSSSDVQVGVDITFGCSTIGNFMPGFFYSVSYFKEFIDCVLNGGTEDCGKTLDVTEAPSSVPSKAPTEATEDDCCTDSDSSKTLLKLVRGFGF